jgi:transposase
MVAIPSIKNEDAKRPNRERENLVSEQTRIINRMKAALIRLGIPRWRRERRIPRQKIAGFSPRVAYPM